MLEDLNVYTAFVPANCSGELQPLDLSVNKPVKDFLRAKFQDWYANEILGSYEGELAGGSTLEPVKFPMSRMKPLGAQWLIQMYEYMIAHPEIMKNGFRTVGIVDKLHDS